MMCSIRGANCSPVKMRVVVKAGKSEEARARAFRQKAGVRGG